MVVMAAAGASVFGLVWKVLPWMRQDNYWIIAMCIPLWAGAFLGLRMLEETVKGAAKQVKGASPKPETSE
ncbi:MAG: hypothetical protein IPK82_28235 [Polyangiaceae bacterium]|nr:hypothetical protein [Polyangiaceae bacterium]